MGLNRSVPHKLYICALNNHLQMLMCRYETNRPLTHRRRSGWNSWGRMASAEDGSVPSGMGYEDGCSSPADEGVSGERRDPPSVVRSSGRKRIFAYFEGHRMLLFTALHGMQTLSSDEKTVCPSVCPSNA